MPHRIYFDNAATTPPDPRVLEAMRPYLDEHWGNPSSLYAEGRQAREAVERARAQVAALLGAEPGEIVFTGSGTEADNLALQGVLLAAGVSDCHIVTSAIEHPAILACCRQLERLGATVDGVAGRRRRAGRSGRSGGAHCVPQTRLVSVMAANNVTGTIQPIDELGRIAASARRAVPYRRGAGGRQDRRSTCARRRSTCSRSRRHKLHGPKGVGALVRPRRRRALAALATAAGQERGRARARRTSPASSAWARRPNSPPPRRPTKPRGWSAFATTLIDGILATIDNAYLIGHR